MTNILEQFEQQQLERLTENKSIPEFQAGDTVRVHVRIIEGQNERVQTFEGLCISRKNRGIHSSFTVRKISHGEGVERIFPLYSPRLDKIELVRRGVVRRAKLYYIRELTGKAARITEKRTFVSKKDKNKAEAASKAKAAPKAAEAKKEDNTTETK